MGTEEQVEVYMCSFDGIRRGNYFGGEQLGVAQKWDGCSEG